MRILLIDGQGVIVGGLLVAALRVRAGAIVKPGRLTRGPFPPG